MTTKMSQAEIDSGIDKIETALESCGALCSNDQPCAAVVNYEPDGEKPWRVSDDQYSESFATVEAAVEAAKAWYSDDYESR